MKHDYLEAMSSRSSIRMLQTGQNMSNSRDKMSQRLIKQVMRTLDTYDMNYSQSSLNRTGKMLNPMHKKDAHKGQQSVLNETMRVKNDSSSNSIMAGGQDLEMEERAELLASHPAHSKFKEMNSEIARMFIAQKEENNFYKKFLSK